MLWIVGTIPMFQWARMATKAQIRANRLNAKKSTGPKTSEGKKVSSQNALRHGLCSRQVVLSLENRVEYDQLLQDLIQNYKPGNLQEELQVTKIAESWWRYRRAINQDTQLWDNTCNHTNVNMPPEVRIAAAMAVEQDQAIKRQRYITSLSREHERAVRLMEKLQKDRRAKEERDKKEAEREARIAGNQQTNQRIFGIGSDSQNATSGASTAPDPQPSAGTASVKTRNIPQRQPKPCAATPLPASRR
jgi:hypothetical protein